MEVIFFHTQMNNISCLTFKTEESYHKLGIFSDQSQFSFSSLFLKSSIFLFISCSCCRLLPASFFLSVFLHLALLGPQVISPSLLDFTNSPNTNSGRKTKEGKYCQKCNLINPEALCELRKSSVKPCKTTNVFLF